MSAPLPVLLVHGIRTSASMWRVQLEDLAADGRPALAIDLPGHGARIGEPFTVEAALEAIDAGVQRLGGRVLLVGLSLGGYFSIEYAARHPQGVAGLIAASCSTLPRGPGLAGYRALAGAIRRLPDKGLALNNGMARMAVGRQAAADLGAGGIALDVMDAGLRAAGSLDPLAGLAAYPGPVWIVNGSLDHFRLDEARFVRANPRTEHVLIPRATHLASLVRPREFTAILRRVAAAVDTEPGGEIRTIVDPAE
ncbi:alpha/beta fold hydrolase [Microterricola viridarii]|uniref:Pimeloyl-ACP methyl ester carboxylesterase n=1 Tax=Microterricola viridarii TaxID=412690 RepID=A0A1H1VRK6_9MICO|nr:alpha/beta fold hydrolase [Microterricola viridarii]SDS87537.1 Pimeloyl-ACP methyl ester carboxylesterase [Microterricola viridarii]